MTAVLHHKHLFETTHADISRFDINATLLKKRQHLSSKTEHRDEVRTIYPKRFSESRADYYTTTTEGKVVLVQNPKKQFKSTGKVSKRFSNDKAMTCPVQLPKTAQNPLKSYSSIPHLSEMPESCSLSNLLNTILRARSDSQAAKNPVANYIVDKILRGKKNHEIEFFEEIPDELEFYNLKRAVKMTYFHAYVDEHWMRVKRVILEIIKAYKLDSILMTTPEDYASTYGHTTPFVKADLMISHTIMSLVHFSLFSRRSREDAFWKTLCRESQKTKFLIEYIDSRVKKSFMSNESGAELAETLLVTRAFPGSNNCLEKAMCLHTSQGYIIKNYTRGIQEQFEPMERKSWVKDAFKRAHEEYKSETKRLNDMRQTIANYEMCQNMDDRFCQGIQDERLLFLKEQVEDILQAGWYSNPQDFVVE